MISRLSADEALLDVLVDRGVAAHQGVGAGDRVHRVADAVDRVERGLASRAATVRVPSGRRVPPLTPGCSTLDAVDAVDAGEAPAWTSSAWPAFAMTATGEPAPAGEVLGEHLLGRDRRLRRW